MTPLEGYVRANPEDFEALARLMQEKLRRGQEDEAERFFQSLMKPPSKRLLNRTDYSEFVRQEQFLLDLLDLREQIFGRYWEKLDDSYMRGNFSDWWFRHRGIEPPTLISLGSYKVDADEMQRRGLDFDYIHTGGVGDYPRVRGFYDLYASVIEDRPHQLITILGEQSRRGVGRHQVFYNLHQTFGRWDQRADGSLVLYPAEIMGDRRRRGQEPMPMPPRTPKFEEALTRLSREFDFEIIV